MDHRRESRLKMGNSATLRLVGRTAGAPVNPMQIVIVDVSGSGMSLQLPLPVPAGAEVEIEDKHALIFGEVLRCDPQGDGYIAAVRVSETTSIAEAHLAAAKIPRVDRR